MPRFFDASFASCIGHGFLNANPMEPESLYRAAASAANDYKDDTTSRLGESHSEASIAEWNRERFWLWAAERLAEHVTGTHHWAEFGARNFSRANQSASNIQPLLDEMQALRNTLGGDGLIRFEDKERISARIAEIANSILI